MTNTGDTVLANLKAALRNEINAVKAQTPTLTRVERVRTLRDVQEMIEQLENN